MKCDDCKDCADFRTENCMPKLWDLGYASGCWNAHIIITYKPPPDTRNAQQKKKDKETQEFYDNQNYKGD